MPIPLQPTRENKGKGCEAKYYFGVERSGNDEGYTPFCHELQLKLAKAAKEGDLAQIRDALRYGASVDLPVDDYDPSLQIAAAYGQTGAVRLLLDNEANVNKGTFIRGTPLIVAAGNGHEEVVKILLDRGADVCFKADGGTAKEFAQKQGHNEIAEILNAAKQADCK
jgi:ankyrin repeat protein